jgi:hypothetical protein
MFTRLKEIGCSENVLHNTMRCATDTEISIVELFLCCNTYNVETQSQQFLPVCKNSVFIYPFTFKSKTQWLSLSDGVENSQEIKLYILA